MITISRIKKAVVKRLTDNNCFVVSSETLEGYEKPAYFVNVTPAYIRRLTPYIDELELRVDIQYEPEEYTDVAVLEAIDKLDRLFSKDLQYDDRYITAPEEFQIETEDSIYLTFSFTITTTRMHNEYETEKNKAPDLMETLNDNMEVK